MPEKGILHPNPLYAFETDPDRIREIATMLCGMVDAAPTIRQTMTSEGHAATEATFYHVEDLDFGDPAKVVAALNRSVRIQQLINEDAKVDVETLHVQITEQIASSELDGPVLIHEVIVATAGDMSSEESSILHRRELPTFNIADLLILIPDPDNPREQIFEPKSQEFAIRVANSYMATSQMTVFEADGLVDLLQDVRTAAHDQR